MAIEIAGLVVVVVCGEGWQADAPPMSGPKLGLGRPRGVGVTLAARMATP